MQRVPEIPREPGGIWLLEYQVQCMHMQLSKLSQLEKENVVLCHFGQN